MLKVTTVNAISPAESPKPVTEPWLLVFDLDGTLIDSSQDLTFSVNMALMRVGTRPLAPEVITGFIGDGALALVRRALATSLQATPDRLEPQRLSECFEIFLDSYRTHKLDTTRPYAGVVDALQELKRQSPNLQMAVLTNKPVRPSREICDALGLSRFFKVIHGGDSFPTKKPDPYGLNVIITEARSKAGVKTRTDVGGVVMIGDAPPDILVARSVGARSIGCLYGLSPDALKQARPDVLVTRPEEWPAVLWPA